MQSDLKCHWMARHESAGWHHLPPCWLLCTTTAHQYSVPASLLFMQNFWLWFQGQIYAVLLYEAVYLYFLLFNETRKDGAYHNGTLLSLLSRGKTFRGEVIFWAEILGFLLDLRTVDFCHRHHWFSLPSMPVAYFKCLQLSLVCIEIVAAKYIIALDKSLRSVWNLKIGQKFYYGVRMTLIPCNAIGDTSLFINKLCITRMG